MIKIIHSKSGAARPAPRRDAAADGAGPGPGG